MTTYTCTVLALLCLTAQRLNAQDAKISIRNMSEKAAFFQPQDSNKFAAIAAGDTVLKPAVGVARYFNLVTGDNRFYPIFCTPGSETMVTIKAGGRVEYGGTLAKENEFMMQHPFNCNVPGGVTPYSNEWTAYNKQRLSALQDSLRRLPLSDVFKKIHSTYLNTLFLYQRINGAQTSLTFSPEVGNKISLPEGYYDFLEGMSFDDEGMMFFPKWFDAIDKAFEEMERQGFIEASPDNYMTLYAERIANDRLRSEYILGMLDMALRRGYCADVARQSESLRKWMTDEKAKAAFDNLVKAAETAIAKDRLTGKPLPQFAANTIDGKTYRLSDFKGKYIMIDFWFTGCVPCKAEMPFYDKLADELKDHDIQFLSISLDTGSQLMETWRRMMTDRKPSNVLHVNIPNGFRSDFVKELGLKSVPRLMVIGKDGTVIDSCAKRPSDPKLKALLKALEGSCRQ